ncbi:hypothetical protein SAMN05192560_1815 [Methylobacillus rhizosphaerae]|uniref:Uncharacterized protein n=1 Tax=Methylobacillus rhizosphaerae TaxID=551994 RepID=A0A239AE12_9PROT|nr:hypothetical protein [Methylobacillus rhizosphaerae]SNR93268.1 hypothetical protein SAMN05192560_1815 [Methylobacillus rhizosphaerae]
MLKHLVGLFFVMWFIGLCVFLVIITFAELYYPIHSWIFADQWRWDSAERAIRFYQACIPASLIIAVLYTVKEYVDIKIRAKNPESKWLK